MTLLSRLSIATDGLRGGSSVGGGDTFIVEGKEKVLLSSSISNINLASSSSTFSLKSKENKLILNSYEPPILLSGEESELQIKR